MERHFPLLYPMNYLIFYTDGIQLSDPFVEYIIDLPHNPKAVHIRNRDNTTNEYNPPIRIPARELNFG